MILTVGHSTRSLAELFELLRAHQVETVVDVRWFPASLRHPHFGREPLEEALRFAGIGYVWLPSLGGGALLEVRHPLLHPRLGFGLEVALRGELPKGLAEEPVDRRDAPL